jgi:hypothetical protein
MEDNTEMDLEEIGWTSVEQVYQPQNRHKWPGLANSVMNFQFAINAKSCTGDKKNIYI